VDFAVDVDVKERRKEGEKVFPGLHEKFLRVLRAALHAIKMIEEYEIGAGRCGG